MISCSKTMHGQSDQRQSHSQMSAPAEYACRVQATAQASGGPLDSSRVLERLRLLQSHLCAYAQRSVPVVNLELASFNETLDGLHDYLLLCIQIALEEDEAALPVQ